MKNKYTRLSFIISCCFVFLLLSPEAVQAQKMVRASIRIVKTPHAQTPGKHLKKELDAHSNPTALKPTDIKAQQLRTAIAPIEEPISKPKTKSGSSPK